jgi:hypothetical protein
VIASVQTGHYFATPFALLFTVGYAYVAILVVREQAARRRHVTVPAAAGAMGALPGNPVAQVIAEEASPISEPPPASGELVYDRAQSASDLAA